jgi:hypothetical protein
MTQRVARPRFPAVGPPTTYREEGAVPITPDVVRATVGRRFRERATGRVVEIEAPTSSTSWRARGDDSLVTVITEETLRSRWDDVTPDKE